MSVKKKLMVSFLVITMLVVISGIVGFTSLSKINASMETMSQNKLPKKELISNSVIKMEQTISSLKTLAMSYKESPELISKINNNIDQINKNLTQLQKVDPSVNKILVSTTKLKDIVKELVAVHSEKIKLYFYHNEKLYNVETFFYHICNDHQDEFPNWYQSNKIENKRIQKYIDRYAKAFENNDTKTMKKHSSKVIKTAARTINMIESSENINFNTIMKETDNIINGLFKVQTKITKELEESEDEISSIVANASLFNIITALGAIIGGIIIATYTSRDITNSLESFQQSLLSFFSFVNKETSSPKLIDIKRNDEFGEMAQLLNENIEKTKKSIVENQTMIDEVVNVANSINQGHLNLKIDANTSDETLNELKHNFNLMLHSLQNHIKVILDTFKEFENNNFTRQNDINCEGEVKNLLVGVNSLTQEISNMLIENMKNGFSLEESSNQLAQRIENLTKSSSTQAAALQETAAALDQITSNIRQNTKNAVEMAEYANEVRGSVNTGQNLANQTTQAMDEINKEVTDINEAISVIDQIAFQTNILSLNAAVEAATAGEAGKGFAVVAGEVRNLASRSAEAANEIKTLVEKATTKAVNGKNIASNMIEGYENLNNNISKTMNLIDEVTTASKEQQRGIEQINDNITNLDKITQENATIAVQANQIAKQTSDISHTIVENAKAKKFLGYEDVKKEKTTIAHEPQRKDHRKIEKNMKGNKDKLIENNDTITEIKSSEDDEWSSF